MIVLNVSIHSQIVINWSEGTYISANFVLKILWKKLNNKRFLLWTLWRAALKLTNVVIHFLFLFLLKFFTYRNSIKLTIKFIFFFFINTEFWKFAKRNHVMQPDHVVARRISNFMNWQKCCHYRLQSPANWIRHRS